MADLNHWSSWPGASQSVASCIYPSEAAMSDWVGFTAEDAAELDEHDLNGMTATQARDLLDRLRTGQWPSARREVGFWGDDDG